MYTCIHACMYKHAIQIKGKIFDISELESRCHGSHSPITLALKGLRQEEGHKGEANLGKLDCSVKFVKVGSGLFGVFGFCAA